MFDSHPDLAIPHESHFVVPMARNRHRYEPKRGAFSLDRFMTDLLAHPRFLRWNLPPDKIREIESFPPATLPDAIRMVFGAYAAMRGKSRYGDKTPNYVVNIHLLTDLLPEARFVHIIRHGRDVAVSLAELRGGKASGDMFAKTALVWRRRVRRGCLAGERLGQERYTEVRYEDLLEDPEGTLRDLCGFLELQYGLRLTL